MTEKPTPAASAASVAQDAEAVAELVEAEGVEPVEAEIPEAEGEDAQPESAAESAAEPAAPGEAPPLVVQCPQCAVPADAQSLCCPSCHEDLVALVRLRYAGRIAFNDALVLLGAGRQEAAVAALERAVAAEPGLAPAEGLLARLGAGAPGEGGTFT